MPEETRADHTILYITYYSCIYITIRSRSYHMSCCFYLEEKDAILNLGTRRVPSRTKLLNPRQERLFGELRGQSDEPTHGEHAEAGLHGTSPCFPRPLTSFHHIIYVYTYIYYIHSVYLCLIYTSTVHICPKSRPLLSPVRYLAAARRAGATWPP